MEPSPHRPFLFVLQIVAGGCMFRRSSDSEDSGDYNWSRLWETPSRKSQRRYARAWVHPLPCDLPLPKVLVVPVHPIRPSEFIVMSSNPTNLLKISFSAGVRRWRQSKRSRPNRWSNYVSMRTACSRKTNAYGLA